MPGPGEVLVKTKAASICNQTDLNSIRALHPPHDHQMLGMVPHDMRIWDSRTPDELSDVYPGKKYPFAPYPTMMGHEQCGEIAAMGEGASFGEFGGEEAGSLKIGQRVVGLPICGGLGEYVLGPQNIFFPLPDNISDEEGSLVEPLVMVYAAVKQAVSLGDVVAVIGQGSLGLFATQVAHAMGARKVIAVDPVKHKREMAMKLGADMAIDPNDCDGNITDAILEASGGGVDAALEVAGEPESIRYLPYIMKMGGIICQIGACCRPVTLDWCYIHFHALRVVSGSYLFHNGNMPRIVKRSIELIEHGIVDAKSMITHRYHELTLENIETVFHLIEEDIPVKAVFLFDE